MNVTKSSASKKLFGKDLRAFAGNPYPWRWVLLKTCPFF
jgi:hypothetical protein